MTLFEDILEGWIPGVLVGIGVALAAPIILPAIATAGRPLAKSAIKGSLILGEKVKEMTAEVGEQISDLIAEVKTERAALAAKAEKSGTSAVAPAKQAERESEPGKKVKGKTKKGA